MDYLLELGSLALGSRLKRLSERISQEVATIYEHEGITFEPRWFPVFHFLGKNGAASIVEIAKSIGVTHPAVNQIAKEMLNANLLSEVTDKDDKRKRLLTLSRKGQNVHRELSATWRLIRIAANEAIEESEHNLLKSIDAMEKTLDQSDLPARFNINKKALEEGKVKILEFDARHREQFKRLNEAWILKFFELEAADLETLSNPERIISDGGMIFFALLDNKVVGTCALIKTGAKCFELAKMAVAEEFHGLGIGQALLEHSINWARNSKAQNLTLETNKKLQSAVRLYEKAGFKPVDSENGKKSKYERVDLLMTLNLSHK